MKGCMMESTAPVHFGRAGRRIVVRQSAMRCSKRPDCQSKKDGLYSPQPSAPEKKCGTFLGLPAHCGLLEGQNRALQSVTERARKKVRNISWTLHQLRTARESKLDFTVRNRAR